MAEPTPHRGSAGWLWPWGMVVAALGVAAHAGAGLLSRTGSPGAAQVLFWLGLLLILLPPLLIAQTSRAGRIDRLVSVAVMALAFYAVKVVHDPWAFTFGDEYSHQSNARGIIDAGGLFPLNDILPVSTHYPGVSAVTAALSQASGLSTYVSGLVVIGAARLVGLVALFLLMERLLRSSRGAAVACCVFATAPNYLFWGAQFSYQSLAFPLAVVVLWLVVWSGRLEGTPRALLRVSAMAILVSVVMSHHLTGYALIGFLVAISVATLFGVGRRRDAAWMLAAFTAVAATAWLTQIAPGTGRYLSFIFERAFEGVTSTAGGGGETRQLFRSDSGYVAPVWERVVSLGSVALLAAIIPFGFLRAWRRRRTAHALLTVLAVAGLLFIATMPLRLIPAAWETANRASDYFYLGVALLVPLAAGVLLTRSRRPALVRTSVSAVVAVAMVGGVIAGWPPAVRLPQPRVAEIGGRTVYPQGDALTSWVMRTRGPGDFWISDESNGRLLLNDARQKVVAGRPGLSRTFLEAERLDPNLVQLARDSGVQFIAIDRRGDRSDMMVGNFFPPSDLPRWGRRPHRSASEMRVYDRAPLSRLFDSGDVVAYVWPWATW